MSRNLFYNLSDKEYQFLRLYIAEARTIVDAAFRMGITLSSASTYKARAMKKLGVSSVPALVRAWDRITAAGQQESEQLLLQEPLPNQSTEE